jgi:hypothetical protein
MPVQPAGAMMNHVLPEITLAAGGLARKYRPVTGL